MNLNSIKYHHIGFLVRDINEAIKWYKDVLGFNTLVPPGICKMQIENRKGYRCMIKNDAGFCLELEQRTDIPFPDNKSPVITHFSVEVDNIEAMCDHLLKHNIKLDNNGKIITVPDKKLIYFTGLDEIRIELVERLK